MNIAKISKLTRRNAYLSKRIAKDNAEIEKNAQEILQVAETTAGTPVKPAKTERVPRTKYDVYDMSGTKINEEPVKQALVFYTVINWQMDVYTVKSLQYLWNEDNQIKYCRHQKVITEAEYRQMDTKDKERYWKKTTKKTVDGKYMYVLTYWFQSDKYPGAFPHLLTYLRKAGYKIKTV